MEKEIEILQEKLKRKEEYLQRLVKRGEDQGHQLKTLESVSIAIMFNSFNITLSTLYRPSKVSAYLSKVFQLSLPNTVCSIIR